MKKLIIYLVPVIAALQLSAQNIPNPYASIGKKAPVTATLSNGEFEEFFQKDTLVQIGTTLMNRYTGEVALFIEDDSKKFKAFTVHNEKNFRFLSVDGLTRQYPELTPYQYASNRPIDGIDRDGLEYATYTITIQNGTVRDIKITTDYELKDKLTLGPGVLYNYVYLDKSGTMVGFEAKPLVTNMYGIYQGDKNPMTPKVGGNPKILVANYDAPPIDEEDAAAFKHDKAYDALNPQQAGLGGVMDPSTTPANTEAANSAASILHRYVQGDIDKITGKKITNAEASGAIKMMDGFDFAEFVKSNIISPLKAIENSATSSDGMNQSAPQCPEETTQ